MTVAPDQGIERREESPALAYRDYLQAAPDSHRQEAVRRLGDLETGRPDGQASGDDAAVDFSAAIKQYQEYLETYPGDLGNDRILYQLARAQELSGQLEAALKTLDRLVQTYSKSRYLYEAQFRRGELLFKRRDYAKAEQAYAVAMKSGDNSQYYERALYMHGWTLFKQTRLEEGLNSFFALLDRKLIGKGDAELDALAGLTHADLELVDDTFRVISISLENLQGAATVPAYITSAGRREYEFRVYQQLAELYIKQSRVKDAADTVAAFAQRQPLHAQVPPMQARVIDLYQSAGFQTLALDAKKSYVARYGARSDLQRGNPSAWENAQPLVKVYLAELTRHYHAAAQKSRKSDDYQEAVRWYRTYLDSFPNDPQAAQTNFLLAELLFEDSRFAEAATEYENTAYTHPRHAKSADAGYAALLAYAQVEKRSAPGDDLKRAQVAGVDAALRFAQAFPDDPRNGAVLTNAADKLYALNDLDRALTIAQQVVKLVPPVAPEQCKIAWTVIAHTAFERGEFNQAEQAYKQVLGLTPEKDAVRSEVTERLAASVYKQGEQARTKGDLRDAVAHFTRAAEIAPMSPVGATAQYDAAAALFVLKDWDGVTRTLEDFRRRFPQHPLQPDISSKLAVAYVEKSKWAQAAGEFERLSAANKDPQLARAGLWQAAVMYERAKAPPQAARVYERYLKQYPQPLEPAIEARYRLARMAKDEKNPTRETVLLREIQQADLTGGAGRTDRTRYLGATATLALAQPAAEDYRKVELVEPLKQSLKTKKAKMEVALKAYGAAAEYGVADVATAATYQTAELYSDFGKALLNSQRPKKLSNLELEQYNVLLEEQAFPFEEKAIELHEVNAKRTTEGIYDEWVKESYTALSKLRPGRYDKIELGEAVYATADRTQGAAAAGAETKAEPSVQAEAEIPANSAVRITLEAACQALIGGRLDDAERAFLALTKSNPEMAGPHANLGIVYRRKQNFDESVKSFEHAVQVNPKRAVYFNQLGISYRMVGQFGKAREAYEQAIALDPNYPRARVNLGILYDVYLWDGRRALEQYDRYLSLSPNADDKVRKWASDLRNRNQPRSPEGRKEQS